MWLRTLTCLFLLAPMKVQALSCMPWKLEHAYQRAAQSDADYVVVQGIVTFSEADLPQVDWDRQEDTPQETLVPGEITGNALSANGFNAPFSEKVTIRVLCFGPWCPTPKPGVDYLAFLEKVGQTYTLEFAACGSMAFGNPGLDMLDRVKNCTVGADCTPQSR